MNRIFISYRRDDTVDICGRIYDRLAEHFGRASLFKDVDDIPLGVDFRKVLTEAVAQCSVMLVIIGRQWLTVTNEHNSRRLDDPDDFVRIEVEAALNRDIPVVPVLVQDARMPKEADLPISMRRLIAHNGIQVHADPHFHSDMTLLIKGLADLLLTTPEDAIARQRISKQADDLKNQKRYAEALPLYERAVQFQGASGSLWGNLGYVYNRLSQWEDALRAHNQALAINSDLAWVWCNRADALRALGRYEEAVTSYQRGLAISANGKRYRDLAVVLRLLGRTAEADEADKYAEERGG